MKTTKIHILSTRPVSSALVRQAAARHIIVDMDSFIETEPIRTVETQQEIEQVMLQNATVIFTSMNAVEAVASELEHQQPDWQVYCIGNSTRQLVQHYFGEERIAGFADSAQGLAEQILEDGKADEVVFFCGNQRRDELPAMLTNNDVFVHEIAVYETIATPHAIDKTYHGILFFSPSAVESFFSLNKPDESTIFFAIGNTTAKTIRTFTNNKTITGNTNSKDDLLQIAIDYFGPGI